MADLDRKGREHFIKLRKRALIELLCAEDMSSEDRERFRALCRMVTAIFHFEFLDHQEELKEAYAAFDPDVPADLRAPRAEADRQLETLFAQFVRLMERANCRRLTREEIEGAIQGGASAWGLDMDVDFDVFERLEVFALGDAVDRRSLRRLPRWWRLAEVEVPVYRWLVLALKLRPHKRLGPSTDTQHVYLKLFKDIPKIDLEMLLPGARLRMPGLQRLKLGGSLLTTLGMVAWKLLMEMKMLVAAVLARDLLVFWGPVSLVLGYGYKQYYGFQTTKQSYSLKLTQSLYYQNLDSNAGVIMRVLDAAEEQECREALLAYFFLWRHGGEQGWTRTELDEAVEGFLERRAQLLVDFDAPDALAKLERFGVLEKAGERYRAVPPERALEMLDAAWDDYFRYHRSPAEKN